MITIKEFNYSSTEMRVMSYWQYATNWPIVYIMHNDTDAYVGETLDGVRRTKQHLEEECPQFTEKGAVVLGVSKDTVASHKKFEKNYGLAFTLLADPERKVIEAYDVWKEKKNYGKTSMGVVRTTYLIDEEGMIIRANDKVKAADDAEKMLGELS
ncbi:peroxiredoxin family protein [Butyrivibrio sp. INlla14]|uniref:peroxiredoxin family protein n=1 Tax=Butyrivibrio sp. INlla14 TaxID=1520808 RepID=UPI00087602A1|nr:peroxiredoxin [Butyrivibrio sp. INlla14]SCY10263.1 peroxiredoxin Q/BCP [Butyrivibrio sp. INlla14]